VTRHRALSVATVVLALLGIAITIFLVIEHQAVYDGGLAEGLFCGGGGHFDCSQVAAHESSWMLGFPLAMWGLMYYIVLLGLAAFGLVLRDGARAAAIGLGLLFAATALVFDGYLAWVMFSQIGAVCLNCVATYAINLLLMIGFGALARTAGEPSFAALGSAWDPRTAAIAATVVAGIGAAYYFTWQPLHLSRLFARSETIEFLQKLEEPVDVDMARFAGEPARGPADAPIAIVVAGDFQCNFCRALTAHVERLERRYPGKLRVIFVNAPVSSACNPAIKEDFHESACYLAKLGECAAGEGRFWPYHDYLYGAMPLPEVDSVTVSGRLARIGLDPTSVRACLASGTADTALARDIALCRELKIETVPGIVINGHIKRGGFYPWAVDAIVRAMLAPG